MMNYDKKFEELITEGENTLKCVSDLKDKAMICAALAQAIAIKCSSMPVEESIKLDKETAVSGKDSLKNESTKEKKKTSTKKTAAATPAEEESVENTTPVEEQPQETPALEVTPEDANDEWNEENNEKYKEFIDIVQQYRDAWEDEYVLGVALRDFMETSDTITDENVWEYIRPTNIEAFVAYLDEINAQNQAQ